MKNYLFAKFYQSLTAEELMTLCRTMGLDGPTAMIREGYWTPEDKLEATLPAFVKLAEAHGLTVAYADTPFAMGRLPEMDKELSLLAECGIRLFRVQYLPKSALPARELAGALARLAETAAKAAEKHGLRAVIQLHGFMYPHNATAVWPAICSLDPRYIGVKLDPGNNLCQEGYEDWGYQVALLGEYIAAVGEKDAALTRGSAAPTGGKGWRRQFVPATEGIADYDALFTLFKAAGVNVPGIVMPFYDENNTDARNAKLREEVAYLKRCQQAAGLA